MAEAQHEPLCERTLALILAWFSPACPIGAYSNSHGLETLQEDGELATLDATRQAIMAALTDGGGRNDAILLAHAWRAVAKGELDALDALRDLGAALCPSSERLQETLGQGNAFAELVDAVWPGRLTLSSRGDWPYPVVVGAAGAVHAVPLGPLSQAFVAAFAANLVSAAVRLVPLGQTDGQRLTAELSAPAACVARGAAALPLGALGGAALGLDLASMRHECQEVRLFRS